MMSFNVGYYPGLHILILVSGILALFALKLFTSVLYCIPMLLCIKIIRKKITLLIVKQNYMEKV